MLDKEGSFFVPIQPEFQQVVSYREVAKSPPLVVKQTHTLLGLYYGGLIHNPAPAREYLHDYTLGYLKAAAEGSGDLYDGEGRLMQDVDLEAREASHHAFVVLALMPDRATSTFLPKGFSRKGMLKPPATRDQFLARVNELQVGIWYIAEGGVEPKVTLEAYPKTLRVFKFFETGSDLPIRLTENENEQNQLDRERFNDLLGGIDISFK